MSFPFSDEQLITFSKRGLLAGPHESLEDFFCRIEASPPLSQNIDFSNLQRIYDIKPDWVKLIYSNKQLAPWEGGCSLDDGETITIQLRSSLRKKAKLFGYYDKQEFIDHELVHAARGRQTSSRFEELFAYKTSKSLFRKKVGAIIQTPKESMIYMLSLLLVILSSPWPFMIFPTVGLNLLLLSWAILRLNTLTKSFSLTKRNVEQLLHSSNALPFLLHLTEEEILLFSSLAPEKITEYFLQNRFKSVRFRQIFARFF